MRKFPRFYATSALGKRNWRKAFSLVEVMLSLGIMAFSLTALVGVLPVALGAYREATASTLRAEMTRQVMSDLQQAPYDSIEKMENVLQERYFGSDGVPMAGKEGAVYLLKFQVGSSVDVMGGVNKFLRPVTIQFYTPPIMTKPAFRSSAFLVDTGFRSLATTP